ncbi:TPA: GyrI-like domain-containing protein [Salmonella enterica subsp. enterica serovar Paratyphi B]|nr:GyrI-like domain-containing protein [Salmonella enterica subsp. enterica serovar Paratyphi B]
MKIENINGIQLTGLSVRTTNVQESHASTAKIAGLWEKFMAEVSPELSDNSEVYGVYTNYASDFTGAFDVVACASHLSPEKSDNSVQLNLVPGRYLTFSSKGQMPDIVINLWREIWNYFSAENCPYSRAYTTDFEFYKSENEVEISIALKS